MPGKHFVIALKELPAAHHGDKSKNQLRLFWKNLHQKLVGDKVLLGGETDDIFRLIPAAHAARDNVMPLGVAGERPTTRAVN